VCCVRGHDQCFHAQGLCSAAKQIEPTPSFSHAAVAAAGTPAGADVSGGEAAAYGSSSHLYRLKPTWRLLPGHCFETLAFPVARDCGLPEDVLRASEAFYHKIMQVHS
jgi:hypothetical protein